MDRERERGREKKSRGGRERKEGKGREWGGGEIDRLGANGRKGIITTK